MSKKDNISREQAEAAVRTLIEWAGDDLVYRLDGTEIYRNIGMGATYSEPMFAILNYAKITDSDMTTPWTMEVDWVKHEKRN